MKPIFTKRVTLCFACVVFFIIFGPTSAYADVYRAEAVVTFVHCDHPEYCEMFNTLSLNPGASVYFLFDYDPDAIPNKVWSDQYARYKTYPALSIAVLTHDNMTYGVMYDAPSFVELADRDAYADWIRFFYIISDAPCPDSEPCLRMAVPVTSADLWLDFRDSTFSACDLYNLPAEITNELFDERSGWIMFDDVDNQLISALYFTITEVLRWCPEDRLTALIIKVVELNAIAGISNALDAKLSSALEALDDSNEHNDESAINRLQAFINAVEAQRGIHIPDNDADALIADAQGIIDALSLQ